MKKRQSLILAGTALGLLMASAPLSGFAQAASPVPQAPAIAGPQTGLSPDGGLPVILAQTQPLTEEPAEEEEEEEEAPAEEPAPEAAPAPEPQPEAEAPAAEEPAPAPAEAPAPEPQPEAPAQAEQPAAPAPEAPATAEEPAAAPEAPATAEEPAAPAPEAPAQAEQPAAPAPEAPAQAEQPAAPAPEAPAQAEQPATPAPEAPAQAEQPATPAPEAPAQAEQPATPAPEAPAQAEQPATSAPATTTAEPALENVAPVLDSQKEQPAAQPPADGQAAQPQQPAEAQAPAEAAPPPANDAASQATPIPRDQVQSAVAEEGQRIEITDEQRRERRRDRREGSEVVQEFEDNRVIIQFNNQVYIESQDQPRISRDAREVYYEELPRGRTREVVVRENGVQVITIRNRYGDVIRRSRITPENREYVLYYVPEENYDRLVEWRDPAEDLPPLRLTIPVEEYILDAGLVEDPDAYYAFLDQPPVERIERIYSIEEVKRSARVRDTVRRVDLDTINFEFGSAEIPESEIPSLEGVANAMTKMLEENPAETFLIEGHTDAVGKDTANLALSDRRAEAVAQALTTVFAVPPENLATQGYGEQYLKVKTEEPEEENRRVAIRRITPLVAPVASAE